MAELTVEDYKRGARKAMEANDVEAAKRLIAKARELDGSSQPNTSQPETSQPVPAGSHRMPDGSVMKDSEMQSEGPDTSLGGALRQGVDQAGKMVGKGIQSGGEIASKLGATNVGGYLQTSGREMAERNEAEIAASTYERPEGADGIIKNLKEGEYKNAGNSLLYGAAEAAPQVAGGIAASVGAGLAATSAPVLGTVAAIGGTAYGTVNALGQMRDEKEVQGMDPTATASDLGAAVASGLVELTPIKGGGATLKVLRETIQEGVQEGLVIGNTAVQGGEYVSEEVVNRIGDAAITGGALAKGTNTLITTVSKTGEVVLGKRKDLDPETDKAAGEVARLIQDLSKNNKLSLKDIDASSTKGANQSLEMARSKIREEVDAAQAVIRKDLLPNAPPEVLAQFNAAVKQSNNKVSSIVSIENLQFIKDNFGNTQQGQALVNAFRKSNVVTEITNAGLKGGISQFTDQFNPLPSFGRAFNPAGGVAGNLNAGAAVLTGGQSLAFQLPAMVGGRAIDAVTGRRSKVARFVRKNRKNSGLEAPTGTSIEGAAKARAALDKEKKNANNAKKIARTLADKQRKADQKDVEQSKIWADDFRRGSDPTVNSPRFVAHDRYREVYNRMGLPPKILAKDIDAEINNTIDQLLSELPKDANPTSKRLAEDLIDYKMSIKSGRNPRNLNSVVGAVATKMMQNSGVTQGPVNTGGSNVNNAAPRPVTPREDGTQSNRKLNDDLVAAVNDSRVRPDNKAKLLASLGELRMNLGSDPVAKATEIISNAGVSSALAKKYLNPYLQRVITQQAAKRAKGKKKSAKTTPKAPDAPKAPDPTGPAQGGPSNGATKGQTNVPTQAPPSSPALVTKSNADPKTKPEPAQVKSKLPEAKALVEIGKKGTKYENGIQDWASALEAAALFNQTVSIFSSNAAMAKGSPYKVKRGTRGQYGVAGAGGGRVFGLKIGGTMGKVSKPRTEVEALTTLLHEIAHGLTLKPLDGNYDPNFGTVKDITQRNNLTGDTGDTTTSNSFVSSAILPILSGSKYDKNHPVIQEVINLQQNVTVYQAKNKSSGRMVRDFRKMSNKAKIRNHLEYTLSFSEFAVDPVWVYMFDPKLAKEVMPETTKLIREQFKAANNSKIRFYSHPVATVLAVVAAMAALGSGSQDEEERPSTGVLTV